jgi:hypothetical protein
VGRTGRVRPDNKVQLELEADSQLHGRLVVAAPLTD